MFIYRKNLHLLKTTYFLVVLPIVFNSCGLRSFDQDVEEAFLLAGKNKNELLDALTHYYELNDSNKESAISFLISNMSNKFYYSGNKVDEFYLYIDSIYNLPQQDYDISKVYSSFRDKARYINDEFEVRNDLHHVSARYLIQNTDSAFLMWGKPWNSHLSFLDFCELILPYRVGVETPEEWRGLFFSRYNSLINKDSLVSAVQACRIVNDALKTTPMHLAYESVYPFDLRPSTLYKMKFGLCMDYADLAIYAMRANGIPVALNVIPHWGRTAFSHVFCSVLDNDGSWMDFSGNEHNPGEHLIGFSNGIPKIYRICYGKQKTSLAQICKGEEIPPFFQNPCIIDATHDFEIVNSKNITIKLQEKTHKKYMYLCVFDISGWCPVAWGRVEDEMVHFENIGTDIVYQLAIYEDGSIKSVYYPFLLNSSGVISYFIPNSETTSLVLTRKSPISNTLVDIPYHLVGGEFEGSISPDFSNPIKLHTITVPPEFKFNTISVQCIDSVKYLRYLSSPKAHGNMAEVEFYNNIDSVPLSGKLIGSTMQSTNYANNEIEKMFDGNSLSYFYSSDSIVWGGIALECPTIINKIRYIIRNDDNGIRKGHIYELLYADNGKWISIGEKIAKYDDEIFFTEIPQNALLWLRDLTKGREERIFEVQDSKVIWH